MKLQDGFRSAADVELFINVLEMPTDGAVPETEAVGDFFVRKALGQEFKDFAFSRGKALELRGNLLRFSGFLKEGDDLAGDFAGHGCPALLNFAQGGDQFFGSAAL